MKQKIMWNDKNVMKRNDEVKRGKKICLSQKIINLFIRVHPTHFLR